MPSADMFSALGAFLQSAGASTQNIARNYHDDTEREAAKKKLEREEFRGRVKEARALGAKRTGGQKIRNAMTAILNPMGPEDAAETLANTPPAQIEAAEKAIADTGAAVTGTPRQSARWAANKTKNAMRRAIAEQESSGVDIGAHPKAANGLQAFGKFGIVPELHIDKVGLDPKKPEDLEKWKKDPALQEATFDAIIDTNWRTSGGDVDKALELYYGKAKDKNAKQRLADGREMPSVNEYVSQVKSRMGDAATAASVGKTAGAARSAIDALVSKDFRPPSRARARSQEAALGKLYADMSPEEIEQNKDYLDRVAGLAQSGKEEYKEELATYRDDLNRQTTAAINAMKLDEQMQMAMMKVKSGVKSLTPEEVRALESRRKLLDGMRSQITDFTQRVSSAKPGAREAMLLTRPDLVSTEDPNFFGRLTGKKGKKVIDDAKILKKLDLIDEWIMETDRALAGLGGLERPGAEDIESDENTMLSRPGGAGALNNYITPVKR